MNQNIHIITLFGVISLAVVAAVVNEALMNDLKQSYSKTLSELTDEDRDDLDSFKQLVLFRGGDIYTVNDLFFDIPEVALSRAIIGYLHQKSGPYQLSEAERGKYTEDYYNQLVKPCENLRGLWLHPISTFRGRKIADKELVESIKAEYEVYELLETAYICNNLVDNKDKMAKKSFEYMISFKLRGVRRGKKVIHSDNHRIVKPEHHVENHTDDEIGADSKNQQSRDDAREVQPEAVSQ